MKAIVNNNREKEVFEVFFEFLSEWVVDSPDMKKLIERAGFEFKEHELETIQIALSQSIIIADEKEYPIYLQADNLNGKCLYCGEQWQGIEDEDEITLEEYEYYLKQTKEEGYHVNCLNKRV